MGEYLLSENDYQRVQAMLQWYERERCIQKFFRRHPAPPFGIGSLPHKIYEVRSAAGADGVYNCYEKVIDATNWSDTSGADKLVNKYSAWNGGTAYEVGDHVTHNSSNTQYKCILAHTNQEPPNATYWTAEAQVLNMDETDPIATYTPALCLYDRMTVRQTFDDEKNNRLVGVPVGPPIRMVRIVESTIPSTQIGVTTLTCNVYLNNNVDAASGELGYNIEVNGRGFPASQTVNWDMCFPILVGSGSFDYHYAYCKNGSWYFLDPFIKRCVSDADCAGE